MHMLMEHKAIIVIRMEENLVMEIMGQVGIVMEVEEEVMKVTLMAKVQR